MPSVVDLLKEVMTLTTNVARLQKDLESVSQLIRDQNQIINSQAERIWKLENNGELIAERSMRAASEAAAKSFLPLMERVITLEQGRKHLESDSIRIASFQGGQNGTPAGG